MLNGVHFLLTYTCNFECDHCFLYCSPWSQGTFTIGQVEEVLEEARKLKTVEWIFYEGGEPFLHYPLLVESIRRAKAKAFKVGVVSNAYGAQSEADAKLWLTPLSQAGVDHLSISNDDYHYGRADSQKENPADIGTRVADELGINTASICIEPPKVEHKESKDGQRGEPVVGGGAKFRGRAVEKLTDGLPTRPWQELTTCPYEELTRPSRVHIDAFGHVHICQGLSMGNMWQTPLSDLVAAYRPDDHPISGPLIAGGPAKLAQIHGIEPAAGYVDECHLCYLTRKSLVERFSEVLAPKQVYGIK